MNRAVLAVDPMGVVAPAIDLLTRLQFQDLQVTAVAAVETVLPDLHVPDVAADHPVAEIMRARETQADHSLEAAAKLLAEAGIPCDNIKELDTPRHLILSTARSIEACLIASGSERKGFFGSLFLGSLTKALTVEAATSLLIGKKRLEKEGKLTAVMATDHSDTFEECLQAFFRLAPKGIGRLIVMTSFNYTAALYTLGYADPALSAYAPQEVAKGLKEETEALAKRLVGMADTVEVQVREGHPNEAIRATMEEADADLLILGAQGHGFMERLALGSISMHQVVSEPHNLLILRQPEKD